MPVNYIIITLAGFFLGVGFISILKRLALKHNVLITKGIPLVGGMGMGLSFVFVSLFGFFLCRDLSREAVGIIVSAVIMLTFGIIDDWRELSISAKLLVQVIAASLLIFFGIKTQIAYIGDLPNLIITFIWVLAITNAFNHLDIIDGLAAGCAMIAGLAFFTVALLNGDTKIAILCLALISVSLSCFIYNFPPAKIYMGNSGSHFLGFTLAAIALTISYAPLERKIALFSPLFILGFAIFDTLFLILMRVRGARPVFNKSNDHLALRFLKVGYSKRRTLLFMLLLCLFFSLCGVYLSQVSNRAGIIIIASVVIVAGLALTRRMGSVSFDG